MRSAVATSIARVYPIAARAREPRCHWRDPLVGLDNADIDKVFDDFSMQILKHGGDVVVLRTSAWRRRPASPQRIAADHLKCERARFFTALSESA